jgi:SAM-dependent methyltransferase
MHDEEIYMEKTSQLTDEEFILNLYSRMLGREGDAPGVAHHLGRLRTGKASRRDIVKVFLDSDEYRLQTGSPAVDDSVTLSHSLTLDEKESLYYDGVRKQDFYGNEYADEPWRSADNSHVRKAEYITKYFNTKRVLDVGCSYGRLVKELRDRGIEAYGIDYSVSFIKKADASVKPYLKVTSVEEMAREITERFDLVICMEVLEHLPLSIIDNTLEEFKRIHPEQILITVPSHGPNPEGRYGFPLHHVDDWVRCTQENRTFTVLPIYKASGLPHCGHVTLASYRWWTDKFLQHGFIRNYLLEQEITYDNGPKVYQMGWCIYVLREVKEHRIVVGEPSNYQLGTGFVCKQQIAERLADWTGACAEFFLKPNENSRRILTLILAGGPEELVYPRIYRISVYQFSDDPDCLKRVPLHEVKGELLPGCLTEIQIDLRQSGFVEGKLLCGEIAVKNTWIPERILNSFVWGDSVADCRPRGIGLVEASLK